MAFADYDFTVPANGSQQIPATGSFVRVRSTSGIIRVSIDSGPGVKLSQGQGFRMPAGKTFRDITVRDVSGAGSTGTIFVGDAGFEDQTLSGNVTSDVAQCADVSEVNVVVGTVAVQLAAWDTRRRGLMLQNQSDTATVWVTFNGALPAVGAGMRLKPGETFYQDTVICMKRIDGVADMAGAVVRVIGWQK